MTTQAELDEMIVKAKAALYAINPAYVLDYVPENEQPLRNVTFKQVDWTGEQLVQDSLDHCPTCNGVMPFSFGVGRPSVYCSDACKMKAYRKRRKSLRNSFNKSTADFGLIFDITTMVFDEESDDEKTKSVGSVCNTHTKVRKPALNDKNAAVQNG